MSEASNRKLERRRRWQRRELVKLFQQGRVLVVSREAPNRPGIAQIVSLSRKPDGMAHVHIEHSYLSSWDDVLDEADYKFQTFDMALDWIETEYDIHWSHFHVPGQPPPGGLPGL